MNAVTIFGRATDLAPIERRNKIVRLQEFLHRLPEPLGPDDFETRHHFAPGQYAREIVLPAFKVVIGKIHRHAHVNVISKGRCLVFTEGEGVLDLRAPQTFISSPGTKRVVFTMADTIWTTIHVTDKTDLSAIENEIIAPSFEELALPPPLEAEFEEVTE